MASPSPVHRRKQKKRKQIFPWWVLLLIIVVGIALLIILNPKERLLTKSISNQPANEVNLRYLENLLSNNPGNKEIQLKIIEQHIGLGNLKQASALLRPFLLETPESTHYWQIKWINYQLAYAQAVDNIKKRQQKLGQQSEKEKIKIQFSDNTKQQLLKQMRQLSQAPLNLVQIAIIAQRSLELENPSLAKDIYQRLAKIKPPTSPKKLNEYAKVAVYAGAYQLASQYYFQAQYYSGGQDEKRKYFLLALQSLQYGDLAKEAVEIAPEKIGQLKDDQQTLVYLSRLALSAGLAKTAEQYITRVLYVKKNEKSKTLSLISYNEEIYSLAYQVFLANEQPKRALMIGKIAVDQDADDMTWQRRLANVAAWAGEPNIAMKQWRQIALKTGDSKDIDQTISLAKAFYNDPLLIEFLEIKIKHHPDDQALRTEWIHAMERDGQAGQAIETLVDRFNQAEFKQPSTQSMPVKEFYGKQLVYLYHRTNQEQKELEMLQWLEKTYGGNANNALKQANIYFNRGDVNRSLAAMKSAINNVAADQVEYWRTLANLAWMAGDEATALTAYSTLYRYKQANSGEIQNLVTLLEQQSPQQALAVALSGWQQTSSANLFFQLAAIAEQLEQWQMLAQIVDQLSPEQQQSLEQVSYFWLLRPYIYQQSGNNMLAIRYYQLGIERFPDNEQLTSAYLWYLISAKNDRVLTQLVLANWQNQALSSDLKNVYALAALQINQPRIAVDIYRRQMSKKYDDIKFLMNYARALDQAKMNEMAKAVRYRAWVLLNRNRANLSSEQLNDLANLALQYHLVDRALPILSQLAYQQQNITAINTLVDWAISYQAYELARYLRNHYYDDKNKFSDHAAMALALVENDRTNISAQLERSIKQGKTPTGDDIIAAERLGHMMLARQLAYERIEANPADYYAYMDLQRILLKTVDIFRFNQEYEVADNLVGPLTRVNGHFYINHRWAIDVGAQSWLVSNQDETDMVNVPNADSQGQVLISRVDNHGYANLMLGYRQALKGFPVAFFEYFYSLNARTSLDLGFGINQRANQSVPLRIAGMQDQVRVRAGYQLSARSRLVDAITFQRFYGQDRSYLGQDYGNTFQWQYLWRQRYPDIGISPFYTWNNFSADGSLSPTMANLIPADIPANTNFFVPYSLHQYGAIIGYGESQRGRYTNMWRPFFSTAIFRTVSQGIGSLGYLFRGGIAGGLFGCDNLSLYGDYSLGELQAEQKFYLLGIQYKYYF